MGVLRVIVSSVCGMLMGGAITAGIFGSAIYSIPNLGHFGTGSMWWEYAAIFGVLCGAGWGCVLGLVVGASKCGRSWAGLLGGGMCLALSAYFLMTYFLTLWPKWSPITIIVLLTLIPLGVISGLTLATITASGLWHQTR